MELGCDVITEKPMTMDAERCQRMLDTSKRTGQKCTVTFNARYAPHRTQIKEMLMSGLIGEIVSFRTTFGHGGPETWSIDPGQNVWFFDKSRAAMGAMADLGIHKTDLIHYLTGQTIVETTARLVTLDKRDASGALIGVDDNAICIYRLSGGALGTMNASWTFYGAEDNSTVLYGTKGILRVYDDPAYSIKVTTREGETILYEIDKIQTNDNQTKSGIIDAFVDCLVENREPEISGAEVLKTMRVIFASIESSRIGRSVAVNHS
jgi:predicted dehydrogenase